MTWQLFSIEENEKWYRMVLDENGELKWNGKVEAQLNTSIAMVDYATVKTKQFYYVLIEIVNKFSEMRQFIIRINRATKEFEEIVETRLLNGYRRITLRWVNEIEIDRHDYLRINNKRVEVELWKDEDGYDEYFFI